MVVAAEGKKATYKLFKKAKPWHTLHALLHNY